MHYSGLRTGLTAIRAWSHSRQIHMGQTNGAPTMDFIGEGVKWFPRRRQECRIRVRAQSSGPAFTSAPGKATDLTIIAIISLNSTQTSMFGVCMVRTAIQDPVGKGM